MIAITKAAVLITIAALCGAAWADDISGTVKVSTSLTHLGSPTASTLTETLSDPWLWAGTTARLGTNGAATGLTRIYAAETAIGAGGTNALDLYGTLLDSFGAAINMAKVKLMFVSYSNAMASATVTLAPGAAAGFTNWNSGLTEGVKISAGGAFFLAAPNATGYPVSNTACDALQLVNNSTNAGSVKVIIAGD
jgi:hypothetical protein